MASAVGPQPWASRSCALIRSNKLGPMPPNSSGMVSTLVAGLFQSLVVLVRKWAFFIVLGRARGKVIGQGGREVYEALFPLGVELLHPSERDEVSRGCLH